MSSSSRSSHSRTSTKSSDDVVSVMDTSGGVELPPLDGPIAVTHEEALAIGYFGGPSDDTDYSVAASGPPEPDQGASDDEVERVAMTDEDDRAALWQQQTRDRVAFQTYLWTVVLAAPPGPRQAVIDAWSPVLLAQLENEAGATDPEDDP